jgi:cytochrome c-type biogenesis protein
MDVTIGLAFIAGLVSFISPCVLPLVPAYIGYMGGRVTHTIATQTAVMTGAGGTQVAAAPTLNQRLNVLTHGLFFVVGFTLVFVIVGLISTAFVNQIRDAIGRIGGVIIIFLGLHFMGLLPKLFERLRSNTALIGNPAFSLVMGLAGGALILWGFTGSLTPMLVVQYQTTAQPITYIQWTTIIAFIALAGYLLWLFVGGAFTSPSAFWTGAMNSLQNALYTDTRRQMDSGKHQGVSGSFMMGVIFSAGWTPCIGPVYGAVLTMAANGGDLGQAGTLLLSYSLGLGIPFLLTALLLDGAQGALKRIQRHMHTIEIVSGALLVLIGILVATGELQKLSTTNAQFAEASVRIEECTIALVNGEISFGQIGGCFNGTLAEEPSETVSNIPGNGNTENSSLTFITPGDGQETSALNAANVPEISTFEQLADTAPESSQIIGTDVGSIAPEFETVSETGQPVMLSDYRGKAVLLNFWATWCGPCKVEMPEFEEAFEKHGANFMIVAVNNRESAPAVLDFRQSMNLTFPMVLDENGTIQRLYGVSRYPSTFVLDEDGVIIARHFGPLTAGQIDQLIDEALS